MPLPVIVAGSWVGRIVALVVARMKSATLLEWVAAGGSIASLVDTLMQGDLKAQAGQAIAAEVATRAGIELNPQDPFSDASMAAAFSAKTGVTIRSLKDRAMIEEDLEDHAIGVVAAKTGYQFRSVRDPAKIKEDMGRIGLAILSEKVGIPAGVIGDEVDPVVIKANLLTWAKAELMTEINDEVAVRVDEIITSGNLEEVAADLNSRLAAAGSYENVTARQVAVRAASQMATAAVADYGRLATKMSKQMRRRLQLRDAQRKFRSRHGNRQKYVPLGWDVSITEP